MVHSVEMVFDPDTEEAVRQIWDGLREAGIPSQAPASRPHATLTVAERIDPEVDALLAPLADRFPFPCRIGAPLLFGRSQLILTRLVVPTAGSCSTCTPRCIGSVCRIRSRGRWRTRCRVSGPVT